MAEIKTMRAKGRGVIGMKIIGNGTSPTRDREKSIRFAMAARRLMPSSSASRTAEIDEAIKRMNRALKEA